MEHSRENLEALVQKGEGECIQFEKGVRRGERRGEGGQASQEGLQNPNQNSIEEFLKEVGRVRKRKEAGECSKYKELE